jgi:uracil-DNA glycosylase
MVRASLPVHDSWLRLLDPVAPEIEIILKKIANEDIAPRREEIFRAFDIDLEKVRVVIFGQDPYPTKGNAMGLAF